MEVWLQFGKLMWSSDWNGDEVGYDDRNVIGLYVWENEFSGEQVNFYIDMETMEILEFWVSLCSECEANEENDV